MSGAQLVTALANVDAEAALVGAMMVDARLIDTIADRLQPEDFSESVLGRVFSAIVAQHSAGKPANPVTLKPFFDGDTAMRELGGPGFLAQLTGSGAALIGATGFADQIGDLARRRRLISSLNEVIESAADPANDIAQLVDLADSSMFEASHASDNLYQPSAAQCVEEVIKGFGKPPKGVRSHQIGVLDNLMGPLSPKQLTILAARPGMGKSACALSYALGAAKAGAGVLFISLEMSSTELGIRIASDLCYGRAARVPFASIRDDSLSDSQRRDICRARLSMDDLAFHVIDAGGMSIGRLAMIVRRYKRRLAARGQSLDLVVVDYLQLLTSDVRGRSNYETVSDVSRGLKAIAKEQEIALLALAQLSREVEKRPDKRPLLSDLRDSGQIEQDADNVLFLYRPEYYLRQSEAALEDHERMKWEQAMEDAKDRLDFILAKRRNGRIGVASGYFYTEYQTVRG